MDLKSMFDWLKRLRQRKARQGEKTVLDKYGATHPAEFFAVATECFFEKPKQLQEKHARLYAELKEFYKQDPARWGNEPNITTTGS